MKQRFYIVLLVVGFLLLAATESETGISNIMGLGMTAFSGWRLGLFGN
ncbi:hypothetical protein [Phocaeicola plebeius]